MNRIWKLYYEATTIEGRTREDWDAAPVVGVQVLMKLLDVQTDAKTRVGWHSGDELYTRALSPSEGPYHDCHFYAWLEDGPAGVTPDAVLDLWAQYTNNTSVRVGDLSLEDLHSVGVKCGRSIPNERFNAILERAINDPEIQ